MYDNENELTPSERAAFGSLPRERAPSDLLEERVVSELRSRGMLSRATRRGARFGTAWRIAAALALFAGGVATGRFILAPKESSAVPRAGSVPASDPSRVDRSTDRTVNTVRNVSVPVAHKEMWL
ncbi:MAG TPA: hypothetical protein VIF83_04440 [Gemmatimonadaceae bacterium]|jgi:hypothetical protein